MFTDIVDLRDFYQTQLGLVVQKVLCARLEKMWPNLRGEHVVTLGYGVPLLPALSPKASAVHAFMPAAQGAVCCPTEGPNISCLVTPHQLPLGDESIDRIIALHAMEGLSESGPTLREIWRALKGNGRFLVIVPNRQGLWAHSDHTPFGNGQPYSSMQIKRVLNNQGFSVERISCALYALPNGSRLNLSLAEKAEKYVALSLPYFGGVLLVEASKQLCAPLESKARSRPRLISPLPIPASASCRSS